MKKFFIYLLCFISLIFILPSILTVKTRATSAKQENKVEPQQEENARQRN